MRFYICRGDLWKGFEFDAELVKIRVMSLNEVKATERIY